ncbi:MAG TPA: T9SS type A sorting domain-containing protein [Parafilimonas sp.]|nr:T9SS type A sorting domain-containing protein [Parafilimonas sp.]
MKKNLPAIAICLLFAMKAYPFTKVVTVQFPSFSPSSFTINIGDSVKWVWVSGTHTTTSLTIPAGAASWNKSITSTSTTFIYVPTKLGTYNYKCTPHELMGMVASFTVVCPQASAQISANGATTFCKGGSVLLNSNVSGGITSFQWLKKGNNISGATSSSYTATAKGSYSLKVINSCGNNATSNTIKVTVNPLPIATITPSGTVDICDGQSVMLQASAAASQTYQWIRNGNNIAGATVSSYNTKKAGNYKVLITKTTTGCSKSSAATKVVVTTCIVSDIKSPGSQIKIYPNPSSGNFNIAIPSSGSKYSLSVFDAKGNLIGNSRVISKDFSFGNELKPGVYLVQVRNGNTIIFKEKIVKE